MIINDETRLMRDAYNRKLDEWLLLDTTIQDLLRKQAGLRSDMVKLDTEINNKLLNNYGEVNKEKTDV